MGLKNLRYLVAQRRNKNSSQLITGTEIRIIMVHLDI